MAAGLNVDIRRLGRLSAPVRIIVVTAMFCVVGCAESTSDIGYCDSQRKLLTDEEFIQIALREQINANRMDIDGSDSSILEFIRNNPTCCRVDRSVPRTLLNRLQGFSVVDVEVNFEVKEDRRAGIGRYYEGHALIRRCGEIDGLYGTGTEALKKIANQDGK